MNYYRKARPARRQSGAALIIAIFVLALAMVIITAMSTQFAVASRRTDNQILADQAWYYLTGAEELAAEILLRTLRERAEKQPDELYRPDLFGQYDTDDGWLAFSVHDLQGRLNLNSLAGSGQGQPDEGSGLGASETAPQSITPVPRNLAQQRFMRLLLSFEEPRLAEPEAVAVVEAVLDWLDANTLETGFGGAEQVFYSRQTPPYRPADMPLRDISELLLVKGITPELFRALRDHVTIWPLQGGAINVAGADRQVMQALYDKENLVPLEAAKAEAIVQAIKQGEVTTMDEFVNRPEWGAQALNPQDLVIKSEMFVISTQTQVGRIRQAMDSVIRINNDKAEVLARSLRML
jgi:general secretion pathway protein K